MSSICGGVISQSYYDDYVKKNGDPYGIMMAYIMPDDKFEVYVKLRESKGKADQKSADEWFDKYARSQV